MLRRTLSDVVERLPRRLRLSLKARHYARLLSHDLLNRDSDLGALQLLVRAGKSVIDIGANVGVWTHHLSQLVGPNGHVWSFEPIPESFALLHTNVERFDLANVVTIDRAVSDEDATVSMSVPRDSRGLRNYHLAQIGLARNAFSLQVLSMRLDSWFVDAHEPHVTFVKIDTEGHELACIRGMSLLLTRCLPALCIEVSSDLDDSTSDGSRLDGILKAQGYEAYLWAGTSFRRRCHGERSINYFFLRREHLPGSERAPAA
jgi:FkbM family methyltransferase